MNDFLIRLWCVMKSGFIQQSAVTSAVVGLRRNSKPFPKTKRAPKKGHGHCLVVCCMCDPLQLSESWRNHEIWEICSTNRWDAPKTATPAADIGQQNGPDSSPRQHAIARRTGGASEGERLGLWSFASSAIFTWPLANQLPLLQASPQRLQGKHFHNQQEAENAFWEFVKSQNMYFYVTGINKLISHWKNVLILIVILNNDIVFEPNDNDLKVTVQNHNYFSTNLIDNRAS